MAPLRFAIRPLGNLNQLVDVGVAAQCFERARKAQDVDSRIMPAQARRADQWRADQHVTELSGYDYEDRTELLHCTQSFASSTENGPQHRAGAEHRFLTWRVTLAIFSRQLIQTQLQIGVELVLRRRQRVVQLFRAARTQ
jgi:hypothetical protein